VVHDLGHSVLIDLDSGEIEPDHAQSFTVTNGWRTR
jgi:hypothetical protein